MHSWRKCHLLDWVFRESTVKRHKGIVMIWRDNVFPPDKEGKSHWWSLFAIFRTAERWHYPSPCSSLTNFCMQGSGLDRMTPSAKERDISFKRRSCLVFKKFAPSFSILNSTSTSTPVAVSRSCYSSAKLKSLPASKNFLQQLCHFFTSFQTSNITKGTSVSYTAMKSSPSFSITFAKVVAAYF